MTVAFIGSGALGGGTLNFRGRSYRFTIGGLGIGGFGISKMEATGDVYNLQELRQFPGAYGSARYGAAYGDQGAFPFRLSDGLIRMLRRAQELHQQQPEHEQTEDPPHLGHCPRPGQQH